MGDKPAYTTKKKEEIRKPGKDGDIEVYFRIWATSRGGTYFHVDVPEDQLDQAEQFLAARAAKLDAI